MAASNINRVEKAHQMYREGRYAEALGFYSSSLSIAKNTPQRIALHSNRAACFLKLHDFKQAADECTSVLELDNKHTGALMLRAQTLVTLKEYQSALFDVSRLLELNPSSEVYLNLQARLKTQLALAPIPEAEEEDEDTSEATVEGCSESDNDEEQTTTDNPAVSVVKHEQEDGDFNEFICSENNTNTSQGSFDSHSNGWIAIPKPKGHSRLDYSRWDAVANGSSDEDDDNDEDDEETQPQYRFRVKTVDVRRVK